ncbi:hypothetical protein BH11PLA2_BH11PLA2_23010 [soil metagenome]
MLFRSFVSVLVVLILLAPSQGQVFNAGSGTAILWNNAANWTPASFPNLQGATATFNVTGTLGVTLGENITVGSITVNNSSTGIMTLNAGNTLILDNGASEASLVLAGTSSTTNNLTVSSVISMLSNTRVTVNNTTVTGAQAGALTFLANISGAANVSFIKSGPGRVSFTTATKDYAGPTVVETGGRLRISAAGRPIATPSVLVNSGGQLYLNDSDTTGNPFLAIGTASTVITINGTGESTTVPGAIRLDLTGATTRTFTNAITFGSDASIASLATNCTLKLTGEFSLAAGLTFTKVGTGNIDFSAPNLGWIGNTIINEGVISIASTSQFGTGDLTLKPNSARSITVNLANATQSIGNLSTNYANLTTGTQVQTLNLNGTALTINQTASTFFGIGASAAQTGVIAGAGSITLSNTSTGTLNLTGRHTYSGGTNINGGTLQVNNPTGSSGVGTGNVVVNVPGTLQGSGFLVPATGNTVLINGNLSPGNNAISSITIGSGTTPSMLIITGTLVEEVTHPAADSTAVFGDVVLSNTSVLNLPLTNVYDATTSYDLISFTGSLTGTFNIALNLPPSHVLDYSSSNLIRLIPAPVPEPTSYLSLLGLLVIARFRRSL